MSFIAAFIIFVLCFLGMAIGWIAANKVLRRGCSIDPDSCTCRKEGKDPAECDSQPPK